MYVLSILRIIFIQFLGSINFVGVTIGRSETFQYFETHIESINDQIREMGRRIEIARAAFNEFQKNIYIFTLYNFSKLYRATMSLICRSYLYVENISLSQQQMNKFETDAKRKSVEH